MEKSELKGVLQRYTQSLKGASGETIITNYGKMKNFTKELNEEDFGKELCFLCNLYTIRQALKAVKEEKICLKDCSQDWNSKVVAKGYQLAERIEELYRTRPKSKEMKDAMMELGILAYDEPSLATNLFLLSLFFTGEVLNDDDIMRMKTLLDDSTELSD